MHAIISFFTFLVLVFGMVVRVEAAPLPTVKTPNTILQSEVQKMLDGGHLRPAYSRVNEAYLYDSHPGFGYNDALDDVWHNSADTIYTLIRAMPYLPNATYPGSSVTWNQKVRDYLQNEYSTCQPQRYSHCGPSGARREVNAVPSRFNNNFPEAFSLESEQYASYSGWDGWTFNPFNYYALYHYARIFNNASTVLANLRQYNHTPENFVNSGVGRNDAYLKLRPHVLNSYIAGYYGWLKLQDLAGETRTANVVTWLNEAQTMRVNHLPTDTAGATTYVRNLWAWEAGGFLWVVPEFGDYLNANARSRVQLVVSAYEKSVPYWYFANVDETTRSDPGTSNPNGATTDTRGLNEGALADYYQPWSLFNAYAFVLKSDKNTLSGFLDAPSVWRGDLFYIHNLVSTIEASGTSITPVPLIGDANADGRVDGVDYVIWLNHYGENSSGASVGDFNNDSHVDGVDYVLWLNNYGKS